MDYMISQARIYEILIKTFLAENGDELFENIQEEFEE